MPEQGLRVVFSTFRRGLVFACIPDWYSRPREQFEGEFLEEVLDDVHHIGADVPNDVEEAEVGQGTRTVDSCCFLGVRFLRAAVIVRGFALRNTLSSIASIWGVVTSVAAEARVLAKPMVCWKPPTNDRCTYVLKVHETSEHILKSYT